MDFVVVKARLCQPLVDSLSLKHDVFHGKTTGKCYTGEVTLEQLSLLCKAFNYF